MKTLSLFSGIGAFEKALKRVGIDYELVNYCEIDKYASKSYSQIHNVSEDLNLWDVTTVDTSELPKDIDLLTHGSPCQDFSLAGKGAGGDKDSGTRSSLMYETVRIVGDVKPKIVVWENVKNVLSKKHKHNFDAYIESLNNLGYNSYYQVLNAKEYGMPQNRERIFVVSIRKDIDDGNFKFPKPFELKLKLKDVLEEKVDEKYYIQSKRMDIIQKNLGDIFKDNFIIGSSQKNTFVGDETICPSLTTAMGSGGGQTPMIKTIGAVENVWTDTQTKMITSDGNIKRYIHSDIIDKFEVGQSADISFPNGYNKANRVHDTMPALNNTTTKSSFIYKESQSPLKIRKLIPKECWRLMGFDDEDFEKAAKVNSDTQLYKQAGNSIVVDVLENIFKELKIYLDK